MNNIFSSNIKIIYMNNVCRKTLGIIKYHKLSNDNFWNSLFKLLEYYDHQFNKLYGQLYSISSKGMFPIEKGEEISSDVYSVMYSEVKSPNNAYRYAEKDGVTFYFHTNENNHMFFPHIHASYSGKEIFISLKTLETTGSLNNRKKEKIAKKYVSQNKVKLLDEWNRLIKNI